MLTAYFRSRGIPLQEVTRGTFVPLRFAGTAREQRATRAGVGLYDFSFMACFEIAGADSVPFLRRLQTRNLARLAPGRLCYTLLLREDGCVFIDATVWCLEPRRYWLVTGRRSDLAHVKSMAAGFEVSVRDLSGRHEVIAVQGPESARLLAACGPDGSLPGYFRHARRRLLGFDCAVARIGYTGELGYELFIDNGYGPALWQRLVDAGRAWGLAECGFEAADALRIETGFILFTRELSQPVTPFELGLGRLAALPRESFLGAEALRRQRFARAGRVLAGLVPQAPRRQDRKYWRRPLRSPP